MLLEDAVYIILRDDAGVGAVAGNRLKGGVLPQTVEAYPFMVYRGSGREPVRTLEGGVALVSMRFAIYSVAETYRDAALCRDAVLAALDEYSGTVTNDESPAESIQIQAIFSQGTDYRRDDQGTQGKPGLNLHEFLTEFEAHYLDPDRITDPDT